MKATIYCEPAAKGVHSFFMVKNGQEYYQFSQDYRKGVQEYYSRGGSLDESINFAKSRKDNAIKNNEQNSDVYTGVQNHRKKSSVALRLWTQSEMRQSLRRSQK